MKHVAVIILNYKTKKLTLKCIDSVKKSSYKNIEIIIIDNNSGDGLEDEIKNIPQIAFIQTGGNLGYTGGNNIGIKKALAQNSDYIFVLNSDTELAKNAIENLVIAGEKDERIGVLGPKILFSDKKTIWFAGGIFDKDNILGFHRGVDQKDNGQFDKEMETDYVTGAAMLIKKEVVNRIGLFDDRYFLYYEDSDYCQRAKKAGFKIVYAPNAVVYHENAKSTGLGSSLQDYFITRNRMLYASKFAGLKTRFALFREAIKNILIPIRRLALYDYLLDNFGKGNYLK